MKLAIVAIVITLAGCATPVSQIPSSDFNSVTADLPINYQAAYRNARDGLQKCSDLVLESELYTDIREGRIVGYIKAGWPFNFSSGVVMGRVTVNEITPSSSRVKVDTQTLFDRGKIAARWRDWAAGGTSCDSR